MSRSAPRTGSTYEPVPPYAPRMSHVATQLGAEELAYYRQRARDLYRKWGVPPKEARRKAYAEMLNRFLPPEHPVLRYYKV